jgi:flagellar protein FliJ
MGFKFRLQALLKHREFVLREAKTALGAAEQRKIAIRAQIEEMREAIKSQCDQLEEEQQKGIGATRYQDYRNYLTLLERQLLELEGQLADASAAAEEQRTTVIERDKSVKLLENLEDRARDAHGHVQGRRELKQADEISMAKEFRKRSGM